MNYRGGAITIEYLLSFLLGSNESFLFVLIVTLNLLVAMGYCRLFLRKSFSYRPLTLPAFFLFMYCGIMLFPSIIYFAESKQEIRHAAFIGVQIVPLLFLMGAHVAWVVLSGNRVGTFSFSIDEPENAPSVRFARFMFFAFLLFSFGIVAYYVLNARYVPLLGAFRDYGRLEGDKVRFAIYEMPETFIFLYAVAARIAIPFCVIYAYFQWQKKKGNWTPGYFLVLGWGIFTCLLSLERQNSLGLILSLGLASYFRRGQRLNLVPIAFVLLGGFVGGLVSRAQYNNAIDFDESTSYGGYFLIMRVWMDPAYTNNAVFEYFGDNPEFLWGRCMKILNHLGLECPNPNAPITAIGFLSDAWINFGWLGIILSPIIYGFLLHAIHLRFFRRGGRFKLTIYIIFMVNAVWAIYGNLASTMIVTVYVTGFGLLILEKLVEGRAGLERNHPWKTQPTFS